MGDSDDVDAVGARLRERRLRMGARLKDIAEQADLSEGYLSQLERGRTRGSIAALKRITQVLGMGMSELFEPDLADQARLMRFNERHYLDLDDGARKAMLTPRPLRHLEFFVGEFAPGGSSGPQPYSHGDSEELLFVIEGKVSLELGEEVMELSKGDSILYQSSIPHRLSNDSDEEAQVVWAISPPSY